MTQNNVYLKGIFMGKCQTLQKKIYKSNSICIIAHRIIIHLPLSQVNQCQQAEVWGLHPAGVNRQWQHLLVIALFLG